MLVWSGLAIALLLGGWGVTSWLDARPNPIVVTMEPRAPGDVAPASVLVPAPGERGAQSVEVSVARERPVPMRVDALPVAGGLPGETIDFPDSDATAAEVQQLRAALDDWLAGEGRGFTIEQTWESSEFRSWASWLRPTRVRVVLHARLVRRADAR